MTQEDKELLLKDVCARLPYGCFYKAKRKLTTWNRLLLSTITIDNIFQDFYDDIKPYLRPMLSMTEEEYDQLYIDSRVKEDSVDILDALANDIDAIDWLNSHHFDYRGLIEKGLALEAPEGMYNAE